MTEPFTLRPHHLLCLRHFTGKGYSPEFVRRMTGLLCQLTQAPSQPVKLQSAAGPPRDPLCAVCPNPGDGCGEKAARYDAAVLSLCGLAAGLPYPWEALQELARERIVTPGKLGQVCGDCQWFSICMDFQSI